MNHADILALTRAGADELGPRIFQYDLPPVERYRDEAMAAVRAHMDGLYPEAGPLIERVGALWSAPEGPEREAGMATVAADMRALAPNACILVWSRVTAGGVDNIEKARWLHRHLARAVLNVFGVS